MHPDEHVDAARATREGSAPLWSHSPTQERRIRRDRRLSKNQRKTITLCDDLTIPKDPCARSSTDLSQRAQERLQMFAKRHPRLLRYADDAQQRKLQVLGQRIFIDSHSAVQAYGLWARVEGLRPLLKQELAAREPTLAQRVSSVATLGSWRMTQGIFRASHGLIPNEVRGSVLAALTGVDVAALGAMPQWCVFLDAHGIVEPNAALACGVTGAWLRLDTSSRCRLQSPQPALLDDLLDATRQAAPMTPQWSAAPDETAEMKAACLVVALDKPGPIDELIQDATLPLDATLEQSWTHLAEIVHSCSGSGSKAQALRVAQDLLVGFALIAASSKFQNAGGTPGQPCNPEPHQLSTTLVKASGATSSTRWIFKCEDLVDEAGVVDASLLVERLNQRARQLRSELGE